MIQLATDQCVELGAWLQHLQSQNETKTEQFNNNSSTATTNYLENRVDRQYTRDKSEVSDSESEV